MAGQRHADEHTQGQETTGKALKRRGLMAAAAALMVGIAAKQTSQPVVAGTDHQPLVIAEANTGTSTTSLLWGGGTISSGAVLTVQDTGTGAAQPYTAMIAGISPNNKAYTGVYGEASGNGVSGYSASGLGVYGVSNSNAGVYGETNSGAVAAIIGVSNANSITAVGVLGGTVGSSGAGVVGGRKGVSGQPFNGTGVQGKSDGGVGVAGVSAGTGVVGTSTSGSGVVGGTGSATPGTAGGYFYNTTNYGSGVVGQVFASTGAAAFVGAAVAPNYAAYFTGDVVVTGNFIVGTINGQSTGGGKSAAVENKAGGHRLVYCVESPDSWFEDFGEGSLVNGKGEVKVDPRFMALIHTDSYHVFLTEHGGTHHHLSVETKGASTFTVTADTEGAKLKGKAASDLNGTFSWRVVGKRSDTTLERFAPYAMPAIKLADKPPVFPAVATPVDEPLPKPGPAPQPQPQPRPAPATAPTAPVVPAAQGGQGAPPASVPAPTDPAPAPNPLPPSRP